MADFFEDLTVVYITANVIPESFAVQARGILRDAMGRGTALISVSKKPIEFGNNIYVGDTPRSQANIYRQAFTGALEARTKYIAIAEDDVLYSTEHFQCRPKEGHWGYNMNSWNYFTWEPNFLHQKPGGRRNLNGLICERDLFVMHLQERFRLWPDDNKIDINIYGEPGKYDNQLGTTPYPSEYFYPNPSNIVFSHEANLQFKGLGKRKKVGEIRAIEVPAWGHVKEISKLYQ